jgi:putative membrane protein
MHNGNWDNGMDGGGWWWIPMMIMMIAFWGALIWLAVALIRRPNHSSGSAAPDLTAQPPAPSPRVPTAQEILAERLARGEIEPDDYRRRLDVLSQPVAT